MTSCIEPVQTSGLRPIGEAGRLVFGRDALRRRRRTAHLSVVGKETIAMTFGIDGFDVDYEDESHQRIRRITIRFGDDHEIEVAAQAGQTCLRLRNASASVALDASSPLCQYERAVNLLRLHMPATSER